MSEATTEELQKSKESILPPTIMNDNDGKPWYILPMWIRYRSREQFEEMRQVFDEAMKKRQSKPKVDRVQTWEVSSSKGDKTYTVEYDGHSWSCTCSGFQYRKRCSHIEKKKVSLKT